MLTNCGWSCERFNIFNLDLVSHLSTHAGLLQQVLLYFGSFNGASLVEVDIYVLPKATGVVISNCLGIAES